MHSYWQLRAHCTPSLAVLRVHVYGFGCGQAVFIYRPIYSLVRWERWRWTKQKVQCPSFWHNGEAAWRTAHPEPKLTEDHDFGTNETEIVFLGACLSEKHKNENFWCQSLTLQWPNSYTAAMEQISWLYICFAQRFCSTRGETPSKMDVARVSMLMKRLARYLHRTVVPRFACERKFGVTCNLSGVHDDATTNSFIPVCLCVRRETVDCSLVPFTCVDYSDVCFTHQGVDSQMYMTFKAGCCEQRDRSRSETKILHNLPLRF